MTLVSTAGRSECTRILCSVTASTSMVTAFSGPRFCSSVENLPPLREGKTEQRGWMLFPSDSNVSRLLVGT